MTEILNDKKIRKFFRLLILAVPALAVLLILNINNLILIGSVVVLVFGYIVFKEKLWIWLVLSLPLMTLGQFINIQITPGWYYTASLSEVIILFCGLIYIIDNFINQKWGKKNFLFYALTLYMLVAVLSYFHIIYFRYYFVIIKIIFYSWLTYYLAYNLLNDARKIKLSIYSLAATVSILAVQLFVKFFQIGFSSKFFFERSHITIPIGAISLVSSLMVLILPVLFAYYVQLDAKTKTKPFILAAFILGWLAVFLTIGRAAIFSLVLSMIYLFFKLKNKRIAMMLSVSLFLISTFIVFQPYFTGLQQRIAGIGQDQNTEFRIKEYKVGWKYIQDNYLFGLGAGQQPIYFRKDFNDPDFVYLVNNFLMQSILDYGLPGILLVLSAIIYLFRSNIKTKIGENRFLLYGFTACFLAAMLNGLLEVTFFALNYSLFFWLIAGLYFNVIREKDRI